MAGVYVDDVQFRGNFAFILQKGYPEKTLYSKALTNTVTAARLAIRIRGITFIYQIEIENTKYT